MPAVLSSSTTTPRVLVTGANGYIGMWVIRTLLEDGYAEGAFDEAVKNVVAIEHTASPLSATTDDPNELINPAVNGTLGVLKSTLKFGTNVKRVVITSSCAAIARDIAHSPDKPTHIFTERDWADQSVDIVRKDGRKAPFMAKYRASKCLAEKAAWKFVEDHKAEIAWDLVTLQPPFVLGPPLQEVTSPASLNTSLAMLYDSLFREKSDEVLKANYSYAHVRDVALAHVKALQVAEAAGERFITSAGGTTWQETRHVVHTINPSLYTSGVLPRGNSTLEFKLVSLYDGSKSRKILGLEYATLEDILTDVLSDFEARGWTKCKD
ncbi:unnamed protein product [Cyclocybe aegerita]|uniref:NAD-dependent epimerase/dehydratase domain-containing protein n=1 Tax=Cyclocybe aegerita TaxID=1973307 RepID=A0A8S0XRR3_CYCAE|nr:unnamed protein product [Cyclocybe aegerita]